MLVPAGFTLSATGEPNPISGYHANVQATPTSYSYPSPTSATDMLLVIMILISNFKQAFEIGNGINLFPPQWFMILMDAELFLFPKGEKYPLWIVCTTGSMYPR